MMVHFHVLIFLGEVCVLFARKHEVTYSGSRVDVDRPCPETETGLRCAWEINQLLAADLSHGVEYYPEPHAIWNCHSGTATWVTICHGSLCQIDQVKKHHRMCSNFKKTDESQNSNAVRYGHVYANSHSFAENGDGANYGYIENSGYETKPIAYKGGWSHTSTKGKNAAGIRTQFQNDGISNDVVSHMKAVQTRKIEQKAPDSEDDGEGQIVAVVQSGDYESVGQSRACPKMLAGTKCAWEFNEFFASQKSQGQTFFENPNQIWSCESGIANLIQQCADEECSTDENDSENRVCAKNEGLVNKIGPARINSAPSDAKSSSATSTLLTSKVGTTVEESLVEEPSTEAIEDGTDKATDDESGNDQDQNGSLEDTSITAKGNSGSSSSSANKNTSDTVLSSQKSSTNTNSNHVSSKQTVTTTVTRSNSVAQGASGSSGGHGVKTIRYRVQTRVVPQSAVVTNNDVRLQQKQQSIKPATAQQVVVVKKIPVKSG